MAPIKHNIVGPLQIKERGEKLIFFSLISVLDSFSDVQGVPNFLSEE